MALKIAVVAGEASGDALGAAFIAAVRAREPDAQFFGVAGPKMIAAGCEAWEPAEALAVMGVTEVIRHHEEIAEGVAQPDDGAAAAPSSAGAEARQSV